MQAIQFIMSRMRERDKEVALFWGEKKYTYREFIKLIDDWDERLAFYQIRSGCVCGFVGDYSPQVCALIFSLMQAKAILVPFTNAISQEIPNLCKIAGVECLFKFDSQDSWTYETLLVSNKNDLILSFIPKGDPGLIVFTSGSTGKPKGILQNCEQVMRKFVVQRQAWNTLLFLMLDHFGGFNTLLSIFAYGGAAICLPDRSPKTVCYLIQQTKATLLPTTPTFINMLLASRVYKDYDLTSLNLITYGTEVMPLETLLKIKEVFPNAKIKQTYGLSELGVLRSHSKSDDSVWIKIGGDGFETKVVDNILWIRSEANMIGYLNAPNPIDIDGWMNTGDHVIVDGEYMKILGRKSEMINIGGLKVFPAEIENVLLSAPNIIEATVFGVSHQIMGQVIHAKVSLDLPEEQFKLTERLRKYCLERLVKYKIPIKFEITSSNSQYSFRYKKTRLVNDDFTK